MLIPAWSVWFIVGVLWLSALAAIALIDVPRAPRTKVDATLDVLVAALATVAAICWSLA